MSLIRSLPSSSRAIPKTRHQHGSFLFPVMATVCSPILRSRRPDAVTVSLSKFITNGKPAPLKFCGNNAPAWRSFASLSASFLQDASSSSSDSDKKPNGGSGSDDNNGKITSKSEDEYEYDPKKDSFFTQENAFGSKENRGLGEPTRPVFIPEEEATTSGSEEDLTAPTNCCMTGCPNCVWIEYVEKLSKKFDDPSMGRERILKELESVDDENIKAYIMMELRIKKLI